MLRADSDEKTLTRQHMEEDTRKEGSHEPSPLAAVPVDTLGAHMPLGAFRSLGNTCRMYHTHFPHALSARPLPSASLQLGEGVGPDEARRIGSALGSALSQCKQPKHMRVSLTDNSSKQGITPVLSGMRASGAHQHVAGLHLDMGAVVPALRDLPHWPHLQSLEVATPVSLEPDLGVSLSQLTGLRSLGLKVSGFAPPQPPILDAGHLRSLTQLTSLSLNWNWWTPSPHPLFSCVASMPHLRNLDLCYDTAGGDDGEAAALASILPSLTALTSLELDMSIRQPAVAQSVLNAASQLPSLQHVGLPRGMPITGCARARGSFPALTSLHLRDSLAGHQEPDVAQLLSRLKRLEAEIWESWDHKPAGRGTWLAQLRELRLRYELDLGVLGQMPQDVRVSGTGRSLRIRCVRGSAPTVAEVQGAVTRLQHSPAVQGGRSELDLSRLPAELYEHIRPLAEAVPRVTCLGPLHPQHMAGWHLKGLSLPASELLALNSWLQAAGPEGMRVQTLVLNGHSGELSEAQKAQLAEMLPQLCTSLGVERLRLYLDAFLTCEQSLDQGVGWVKRAVRCTGVQVRQCRCAASWCECAGVLV